MGKLEAQYSRLIGEPRVGYLHGQATPDMFGAGTGRALRGLGDALGDLGRLYAGFLNDKTDQICSNYAARCREAIDSYVKGDGTYDMDKINSPAWQEKRKEILNEEIEANGGNYNRKRLQMYVERTDMHNDGYLGKIYRTQEFAVKKATSLNACNEMLTNFLKAPSFETWNALRDEYGRHGELLHGANAAERIIQELEAGKGNGVVTIGGRQLSVIDDENGSPEEIKKRIEEYKKDPKGKRLASHITRLIEDKQQNIKLYDEFVQAHMDQAAWGAFTDKLKAGEITEAGELLTLDGLSKSMQTQMQTMFDRQQAIVTAGDEGRSCVDAILKDFQEGDGSDGGKYLTKQKEKQLLDGLAAIDTTKPNGDVMFRAYKERMNMAIAKMHAQEEADIEQDRQNLLSLETPKLRDMYIETLPPSWVKDKAVEFNKIIERNRANEARLGALNHAAKGRALKVEEQAEKKRLECERENRETQAIYDFAMGKLVPHSRNQDDKSRFSYCCLQAGITDAEHQDKLWNYLSTPQGKYAVTMANMLVSEINGNYTSGTKMDKTLKITTDEISKVMPELIYLGLSFTPYSKFSTKQAQQVNGSDDDLLKNAIYRMMREIKVRKELNSDERISLGQWIAANRETWQDMDEESIKKGRLLFEKALADWHADGNEAVYRQIIKQIMNNKLGENGVRPSFMMK